MLKITARKNLLKIVLVSLIAFVPFGLYLLQQYILDPAPVFRRASETSKYLFEASNDIFSTKLGLKKGNIPEIQFNTEKKITFTYLPHTENINEKKIDIKEGRKEIIFKEVEKGVDIKYSTLWNGLKEDIILNEKAKYDYFIYELNSNGLKIDKVYRDKGTLAFKSGDNYLFHIDKLYAYDDNGNETQNVGVTLLNKDGKQYIRVKVDTDWIFSKNRKYPITIDPTIIHDTSSEFSTGEFNRGIDSGSGSSPILETYYQELPADEHTIGLWHLNEASGNVYDSSGNGFTGTPAGTTVSEGVLDNSRNFNGSSDNITLSSSSNADITGEITVEAWIKPSLSGNGVIVHKDYQYSLRVHSTRTVSWADSSNWSFGNFGEHDIGIVANQWQHIALTKSNGIVKIYLNGKLKLSKEFGEDITSTTNIMHIGCYSGVSTCTNSWYSGEIDEIRISDTARTTEEIKASASRRSYSVYTSEVIDLTKVTTWNSLSWTENGVKTGDGETPFNSTNLHSQWDFNETSGTTANNDAEGSSCGGSPASCDGTLTGFDSTTSQDANPNSSWTANNKRWGNGALKFDGTNSTVTTAAETPYDFNNDTAFSINTWIKTDSATQQVIFSKMYDAAPYIGYELYLQADGLIGGILVNTWATNNIVVRSYTRVDDGEWHQITFTYSGSSTASGVNMYIDGKKAPLLVIYDNLTSPILNNVYPNIGSRNTTNYFFNGVIDSTSIYQRELTENEIIANYNSTNIEFQTRVGADTTPNDGSWENWEPVANETQLDSFDSNESSNWLYRKEIDITHTGTAVTEYQILVESLDTATLISNDKLQDDCGDLRFTNTNGDLLPYSIVGKTCNSTNTMIWVQVDSIPASGGTTIYMFYGNILAENGEDEMATFTYSTEKNVGYILHSAVTDLELISFANDNSISHNGTTVNLDKYETNTGTGFGGGSISQFAPISAKAPFNADDNTDDTDSIVPISWADTELYFYNRTAAATTTIWAIAPWGNATVTVYAQGTAATGCNGVTVTTTGSTLTCTNVGQGAIRIASNTPILAFTQTTTATDQVPIYPSTAFPRIGSGYSAELVNGNATLDFSYYYDSASSMQNPTNLAANSYLSLSGSGAYGYGAILVKADTSNNNFGVMQEADGDGADAHVFVDITEQGKTFGSANQADYISIASTQRATCSVYESSDHSLVASGTTGSTNTEVFFLGFGTGDSNTLTTGGWYMECDKPVSAYFQNATAAEENLIHSSMNRQFTYPSPTPGTPGTESTLDSHTGSWITLDANISRTITQSLDSDTAIEGSGAQRISTGRLVTDEHTVGLWHLDETGGSGAYYKDSSGNAHHGTPTDPTVIEGVEGKAIDFNGSTSKISIPANTQFDFIADYTLEAWVKYDATPATMIGIMGKYNAYGWGLNINTTGKPNFGSHSCSNFDSQTTLTPGQWYHIVGVYNEIGDELIYLNGKLDGVGTLTDGNCGDDTSSFVIGQYRDSTLFDGKIDEVRVSNIARSAEEIQESYNLGRSNHISKPISSTNLTTKSSLPFYIAADKPGTYLSAILGESMFANNLQDEDTIGFWHLEEEFSEIPRSCYGHLLLGATSDGVYTIDPDGPAGNTPIQAYCNMTYDGGGWTMIVKSWYGSGMIGNSAAVGTVSDATTLKGNSYKLSDENVRKIIGPTQNFDVMADQNGYNTAYSTGNYEYVVIRNYTGLWTYEKTVEASTTTTSFQSYRASDQALAWTGNLQCGYDGGYGVGGINCLTVLSNNPQGGAGCAINMGTATNIDWHHFFMNQYNDDTYLYICNGPQHSSGQNMNHRFWVRETYPVTSSVKEATGNLESPDPGNYIRATGGNISYSNGYTIHTFLNNGTFQVLEGKGNVEALVVAGGGGGGMDMGGGGGGGGFIHTSAYAVTPQSYTITVGTGGAGAPAAGTNGQPTAHPYTIPATNGGNSVFGTLTAIGGGAGGSTANTHPLQSAGYAGGSGGGASGYMSGGTAATGGVATTGQGYPGGNMGSAYYSGGGGGAGATGASGNNQANGGSGKRSAILGTLYYWAGGGGGSGYSICGGNGGIGGGGGGAVCTTTGGAGLNNGSAGGGGTTVSQTNTPGGNAGANTGGGGGGGSHYNSNNKGGDGGTGIVVIRYPSGPINGVRNNVASRTSLTEGKIGKGHNFSNTSDNITITDNDNLSFGNGTTDSPFTISAWIYPKTIAGASSGNWIVNKRSSPGISTDDEYQLNLSEGKLNVALFDETGGGYLNARSLSTLNANQWYHVAVTYDGSSSISGLTLYVNGVKQPTTDNSSGSYTAMDNLNGGLVIGKPSWSTGLNFDGTIDEVRIDKVERTASEIRAAYEYINRTFPITIDFAASLSSGDLISDSNDKVFEIDATTYGLKSKGENIYIGEKIIIRENINGSEYIAQGLVSSITQSTGEITVSSWDVGSTFPSSGFSNYADVFKWQKEYLPVNNLSLDQYIDSVSNITLSVTNGTEAREIWIDDLKANGSYLTTPSGSTIDSTTGSRYMQYSAILNSSDSYVSPTISSITLDYEQNYIPNVPILNSPTDRATGQILLTQLKTTATDADIDYLRYKIEFCKDALMTRDCQTFDQTSSQTGWSGQNAQTGTAYTSGTQATYTIQSALQTSSVYYWRSYAIDPAGTNLWSETQSSPNVFSTNSKPRSSTVHTVENYIARRESSFPRTSTGWGAITGNVESGTTASTNGWIAGSNFTVGEKYLIMVWGSHQADDQYDQSGIRVKHGSTPFTESQSIVSAPQTYSSSYKTAYNWFTVWTASNEDLEAEIYWNGVTGTSAIVEDITLLAINVEDLISSGNLIYDIQNTGGTLTTSFEDKSSVSWTPDSANNTWWINGYSQADITNTSTTYLSQIYLNGMSKFAHETSNWDNTDSPVYGLGIVTELPATSNSASIQIKEGASDHQWNSSGIFALNLNYFETSFYASLDGDAIAMDTPFSWVQQVNGDPLQKVTSNFVIASNLITKKSTSLSRIQSSEINITDDTAGWLGAIGINSPLPLGDVTASFAAGLKNIDLDSMITTSGAESNTNPWLVGFSLEKGGYGPTLNSPANSAPNQPLKPILKMVSIDPDNDALKYKIDICEDDLMTLNCQTFDQTVSQIGWSGQNAFSNTRYTSGTEATYTVQSNLAPSATYYWRSYAIDPSGTNQFSLSSEIYSFTTTDIPTAPTLLETEGEANPTAVSDLTPEFSAIHNDPNSDNANFYQLEVNTQEDFAGTVLWDSGKTSMTSTLNASRSPLITYAGTLLLGDGSTHYWRIKFWDENGAEGSWSLVAQFTMDVINEPNGCYLEEGEDDSSIIVHWNDTNTTEEAYKIQKSTNGGAFSDLITLGVDSTSYNDTTTPGNTYKYRIAAILGTYTTPYCTTTTDDLGTGSIRFEGIIFE